jgi:phosphoserine aminotransferase
MSPLSLPDDLRPADGRFGSGPSKVRPAALAALAATGPRYLGTSHRREGVRSVVRRVRHGIAALYGLPDGHEVVLGNGGATAFWDAAAFRLVERRSLHYSFGEFSAKFAAVTTGAPFLDDPVVVTAPPGCHPDPVADGRVDAYALTHNETSTGVSMPVERPGGPGLVLVDGTSAAGAIPADPASFDAYYFSPQKAFGSDGGLWVAMCSPAALERIASIDRWTPRFLDLRAAVEQSRKDQTLNTPALATLFLLADQVDWLLARGGLGWSAARGRRAADLVYGWAEASEYAEPFVADPAMRSTTVATVDLAASVPAAGLTGALRDNGIVDVEAYRGLARNQVRIGMWPAVDPEDLERLLAAIDWLAERLGE